MMRLKVVDDYRTVAEVEADTIDTLKARIMESFSLKKGDLRKRLLVPDGREIWRRSIVSPMVNGIDLLELKKGSILRDHICDDCLKDDGDILLLGWKGPFIINLVSPALYVTRDLNVSLSIEVVDPYVTLGELKQLIHSRSGKPVTKDNLPRILFEGDDSRPLLFFGFYNYYKTGFNGDDETVQFYINLNRANKLVFMDEEPGPKLCVYRTEPATPHYLIDFDINEDRKKVKMCVTDRYGEMLLIPKKKMKMNKGMDDDAAGPSYKLYQLSKKEMEFIESVGNASNDTTKQRKRRKSRRIQSSW